MTEGAQTINGAKTFSDFTLSATEVAIASGDHLVIADNSNSDKIKDATLTFGTDTTTFLANNGTWGTPWKKVYGNDGYSSVGSGTGTTSITLTEAHTSYSTYMIQLSNQGVVGGPPPATSHESVIVTLYDNQTTPTSGSNGVGWLRHNVGTTSTVSYFIAISASGSTMYFSNKYSQVQNSATASADTIASATTMYVRNIYKLIA
jgi:hypothetical protein